MTKNDLTIGMVVQVEDMTTKEISFAMVCETIYGKCISGKKIWFYFDALSDDLVNYDDDLMIIKVLSVSKSNQNAYKVDFIDREIVWNRM